MTMSWHPVILSKDLSSVKASTPLSCLEWSSGGTGSSSPVWTGMLPALTAGWALPIGWDQHTHVLLITCSDLNPSVEFYCWPVQYKHFDLQKTEMNETKMSVNSYVVKMITARCHWFWHRSHLKPSASYLTQNNMTHMSRKKQFWE